LIAMQANMAAKEDMPTRFSIGDVRRDLFQKNACPTKANNTSAMLTISRQMNAVLRARFIEFKIIVLQFKM